jgi:RNA polymerase sigma factor (TIGR02999 family)
VKHLAADEVVIDDRRSRRRDRGRHRRAVFPVRADQRLDIGGQRRIVGAGGGEISAPGLVIEIDDGVEELPGSRPPMCVQRLLASGILPDRDYNLLRVSDADAITALLHRWRSGDEGAASDLMPLVYSHLRRLAHRYISAERPDHTLQATALVHEAFLQLGTMDIPWQDRAHFMCTAARAMRRILVDHARAIQAQKRGGDVVKVPLEENAAGAWASAPMTALDDALEALAHHDPRQADIVQLHYFGGLTQPEIAATLAVSLTTVERDLRMARAWLRHELNRS